MTILGKLRGEIKDQEKVPLPMNLNDEALLHHGSLIAVSFLLFFCAIVGEQSSSSSSLCRGVLAPFPVPFLSFGPRATSLASGWLCGRSHSCAPNSNPSPSPKRNRGISSLSSLGLLAIDFSLAWNSRCPCTVFSGTAPPLLHLASPSPFKDSLL